MSSVSHRILLARSLCASLLVHAGLLAADGLIATHPQAHASSGGGGRLEIRLVASAGAPAAEPTIRAQLLLEELPAKRTLESSAPPPPVPADLEPSPSDPPPASLREDEPEPRLPALHGPDPLSALRNVLEAEPIGERPDLSAPDGTGSSHAVAGAPEPESSSSTPVELNADRAASRTADCPGEPRAGATPPGPLSSGIPSGEPAVVAARLQSGPKPDYPSLSVRLREEGSVRCELSIHRNGAVVRVEVLRSSGFARLDRAAREMLLTWRFAPARRDGTAIPSTLEHTVTFKLDDERY